MPTTIRTVCLCALPLVIIIVICGHVFRIRAASVEPSPLVYWPDLHNLTCNPDICGARGLANPALPAILPVIPTSPKKRRIAIVSYLAMPNSKNKHLYLLPMAHQSQLVRRVYAAKHGYDVIWEDESMRMAKKTEHWGKLITIAKWLPHYDWIWWLDVDTLIMNHTISLEWLIDKHATTGEEHLLIARDSRFLNSGSMLLKNDEDTMTFLRDILKVPEKFHFAWEQGAINELAFNNFSYPYIVERRWTVLVHPALLNAGPPGSRTGMYDYHDGDFVVHFAGFLDNHAPTGNYSDTAAALFWAKARPLLEGSGVATSATDACCFYRSVMRPHGVNIPVSSPNGFGLFT
jgi:hypothetical protein